MLVDTHRLNSSVEVLVVDDEEESRAELSAAIAECGHVCFAAADAEAAIRKARSRASIGVVVTDVKMPGEDGFALIRRIRADCPSGRVPEAIIVTGYPGYDVARGAVRLSAVDFLTKPVSRGDLVSAVDDASRRWEQRVGGHTNDELEARLRHLSSEFSRLCADFEHPAIVADEPHDRRADAAEPLVCAEAVKSIIRARERRETYFGAGLFTDPTWNMLLDLSAASLEGKRVTVSSLCAAAKVPHATALRRIEHLVEAGLAVRRADDRDRRRVFIELTPEAERRMTQLLGEILTSARAA